MAGVSFFVAAGANTGGIVLWRKCKNDIFIVCQIVIPRRREEGAKRELFYRVDADRSRWPCEATLVGEDAAGMCEVV